MINNQTRILVIGIDGATFDLIKPWAEKGLLPNFLKIMEAGSYSELKTIYPVISAAAWTTFITGVNPGKHGIYDFIYRDKDSYNLKPTSRLLNHYPSLWSILSQQDKRVLVFNVPMTYPPENVNGIMVTGLGTPNYKNFTYPGSIGNSLLDIGYKINREQPFQPGKEGDFINETYARLSKSVSIFKNLLSQEEWDFAMVVLRETDEICHYFWHYMDPTHPKFIASQNYNQTILKLYQEIDDYIGDIHNSIGKNTTTIIMSDHGFGPLYKQVFLNEWLFQEGLVQTKNRRLFSEFFLNIGVTRDNISNYLRKHRLGIIEKIIKDILRDAIYVLPKSSQGEISVNFDWSRTKAYSHGFQGQIFINLQGREPKGIVSIGQEYNSLVDDICERLNKLTDPSDGLKVVDQVYKKSDLYFGDHYDTAPDIVITMRDLSYSTKLWNELGSSQGAFICDTVSNETGNHRYKGILIAEGPAIKSGIINTIAWIGDIAPTILHLLKCRIPKWMDGRVITEWFTDERSEDYILFTDQSPENFIQNEFSLSQDDEENLLQRLSDLGYLE